MTDAHPWLSLDPDEDVVWSGTPRPHVVAPLAAIALLVPAVLVLVRPAWYTALAGTAVWIAVVAAGLVYVRNVEFVVSTKYLYAKRGVLGRRVTQVGLANVQDTTLRQGILGTQFGHGTVGFSTAGGEGAQVRMYAIPDPSSVKAAADRQLSAARSATGTARDAGGAPADASGPETAGDATADEVLSEARQLRAVAERLVEGLARDGGRNRRAGADGGERR